MHWTADHLLLWQSPITHVSLLSALNYYHHTLVQMSQPFNAALHTVGIIGAALLASKALGGRESNWLFDGASLCKCHALGMRVAVSSAMAGRSSACMRFGHSDRDREGPVPDELVADKARTLYLYVRQGSTALEMEASRSDWLFRDQQRLDGPQMSSQIMAQGLCCQACAASLAAHGSNVRYQNKTAADTHLPSGSLSRAPVLFGASGMVYYSKILPSTLIAVRNVVMGQ